MVSSLKYLVVVVVAICAVSSLSTADAAVPPHERARVELLQRIGEKADEPWTRENEVELLHDGEELFPARMEMIRNAEHSIDLITFLWCDDEAGQRIASELVDAAYRGVRVRVMVDFFNLTGASPIYEMLEAAGIRPLIYNPPAWGLDRINKHIHEKIMVVDGDEALVGGANLCNEYLIRKKENLWHELELRIRGTLASRIQLHMDRTWNFMAQQEYKSRRKYRNSMPRTRSPHGRIGDQHEVPRIFPLYEQTESSQLREGTSRDLFLYQQPYREADDTETFLAIYSKLVRSARDELFVVTPYLIPAPEFKEALVETARRGVSVTVLTNSRTTNDMGKSFVDASHGHYRDLLQAGIEIYESLDVTVHSKAMRVDSDYLLVGSHNFTNRSFEHNGESAILTLDKEAIARFEKISENNLEAAERIDPQEFLSQREGRFANGVRSWFSRWLGRFF